MAFQEVTMKLSGWAALACVAVLTIACDRGDNANRTASNRDNSVGYSATDRDDTANTTLTQGTSGQAARTSDTGTRSFAEQAMMAKVDGHREVKNMLEDHAKPGATATGTTGKTADNETAVNQWASKTLPAVEQHLQKAEQISSQVSK